MCLCRVCLQEKDDYSEVVILDSATRNSRAIKQMLDDIVHPSLYDTRAKLSDEICDSCVAKLKVAHEFKKTYQAAIVYFANNAEEGSSSDSSTAPTINETPTLRGKRSQQKQKEPNGQVDNENEEIETFIIDSD